MKNIIVKKRFAILLVIFCINNHTVFSQTSFSYNKFKNGSGDSLNYRLLFPDYDTLRKYPLVVFLHGAGENGTDNESQLKWGVLNFAAERNMIQYPAFVLAPQCPKNVGWANFSNDDNGKDVHLLPTPTKPMKTLIELIQQLTKTLRIDTNKIYITGLSSGGFGTYDAIERYPQLFAAAVPVCGGGDISKATSIAHIPIWIFHGAEDAAVSPLFATRMADELIKNGAHPGLTLYPGVGHFAWLGAYTDPLLMEWLFRQHK